MNLLLPSSTVENWFDRCIGNYVSYRRYLYFSAKPFADPHPHGIRTEFITGKKGDREYFVTWESQNEDGSPATAGTMNFRITGSRLTGYYLDRDRSYFNADESNRTRLQMIDRDTMAFFSAYGGHHYREEIRFLSGDDIRLRQTVGFSDNNHKVRLCGQYFEQRQQ